MGAQESKLSFRRGIFRLHEERNIPASDTYWQNYWTLPESAEDIFTLFSASDIRKARDEAPENLESLFRAVCSRMFELRQDGNFPRDENLASQMLNCLRILTRLIPFLFEDSESEERILWGMRTRSGILDDISNGNNVTASNDRSVGARSEHSDENPWHKGQGVEPIAEELIKTMIDLLFFCGFTIPSNYGKERVVFGIWETGVGCTVPMGTTKQFESNKIETLRCILALISGGMYVPASMSRIV